MAHLGMDRDVVAELAKISDASLVATWCVEDADPTCADCCFCCAPTHALHWLAFEDATRSHVRHGTAYITLDPWPCLAHAHVPHRTSYIREQWIRSRDAEVDRACQCGNARLGTPRDKMGATHWQKRRLLLLT